VLVIRRKQGESILVGAAVEIRVVEVTANRVVLGVLAPSDVPILRKELSIAAAQNQAAARTITPALAAELAAKLRLNSAR
jgi:carbon storage regulator